MWITKLGIAASERWPMGLGGLLMSARAPLVSIGNENCTFDFPIMVLTRPAGPARDRFSMTGLTDRQTDGIATPIHTSSSFFRPEKTNQGVNYEAWPLRPGLGPD